jgi:hypothetical protein
MALIRFHGKLCQTLYWLSRFGGITSYFASPGTTSEALTFDAPDADPAGITFDRQYLWVTNASSDNTKDKIYKIDTSG